MCAESLRPSEVGISGQQNADYAAAFAA
jgi:hypothetical protein